MNTSLIILAKQKSREEDDVSFLEEEPQVPDGWGLLTTPPSNKAGHINTQKTKPSQIK